MGTSTARDPIRFAEKLIVLLDQGGFTATYKYAVLVALMDLSLELSADGGIAPTMVTTPQLANKIVQLYWPQTRAWDRGATLRQNRSGQAKIVSLIADFKERHSPDPSASLYRSRLQAPQAFAKLCRQVEWKLVQMPLPKLQRVGSELDPFVYTIGWNDGITKGEFDADTFDNRILFKPNAADHLVRLTGVLRPLIYRQWASMVAQLNDLDQSHLEQFLFGCTRDSLAPVREPLLDLQRGTCFYCRGRIGGAPHVDHFLPWARHPDDGLDNLVVAHERCNLHKSDFLAAGGHVRRWAERVQAQSAELEALAQELRWARDRARTFNVVRAVYSRLPDDARLWQHQREFVPLQRNVLGEVFGPPAGG